MEINSKNCSTCIYYQKLVQYNEQITRCVFGEFDVENAEQWVCDKYKENKNAIKEFLKKNFKNINNFRPVNETNNNVDNIVFKK